MFAGCKDCEFGWRTAHPRFVETMFPMPTDPTPGQVEAVGWLRAVYPTYVYPCETCRGPAFTRWKNGCLRSGHEPGGCPVCGPARRERVPAAGSDQPRPRDHTESRTADNF